MFTKRELPTLVAAAVLLGAGGSLAQETGTAATAAGGDDRQVAEACLQDLEALNARMDRDGYWLTGWGTRWNYGYGVPPAGSTPPPASGVDPEAAGMDDSATAPAITSPWGDPRIGMLSPRHQIRTLHAAANVLAHRGDQAACDSVLQELEQAYTDYVTELRQAGVEPGQVATWRQERIISAKPVAELEQNVINLGDVTGTEIRNMQDEELGTVSDVVIDPASGEIEYVIVSTGGVFGIGSDQVAVPWQSLKATPGLNAFVLDVPAAAIEQAPRVDPDRFADPNRSGEKPRQVDRYWEEQLAG